MDYKKFNKEDFDAIVTGELTHYALWFEGELVEIITDYFLRTYHKKEDFKRLLLLRDGSTFQNKIEIVRGLIPLFTNLPAATNLKNLLKKVENFKSLRNALAHGREIKYEEQTISIEIVNRAGKEVIYKISPESHNKMMGELDALLLELQKSRKTLLK